MANNIVSNPATIDTAAGSTMSHIRLRELLWVDDAADIVNDSDLSITINGATITCKPQRHETVASVDSANCVIFRMGPYNPGILCTLVVNTIDAGIVVVVRD